MRKITVEVKLKSKIESIEKIDEGHYIIRTNTPPIEGAANKKIIELMAKELGVPKSKLEIIRGLQSKKKILKVTLS